MTRHAPFLSGMAGGFVAALVSRRGRRKAGQRIAWVFVGLLLLSTWWQTAPEWQQLLVVSALAFLILRLPIFRPGRRRAPAVPGQRQPLPQALRMQVVARDNWECGICLRPIEGMDDLHIDHIHPVHAGGTNELRNLQAAHEWCNLSKGGQVGWQPPYRGAAGW